MRVALLEGACLTKCSNRQTPSWAHYVLVLAAASWLQHPEPVSGTSRAESICSGHLASTDFWATAPQQSPPQPTRGISAHAGSVGGSSIAVTDFQRRVRVQGAEVKFRASSLAGTVGSSCYTHNVFSGNGVRAAAPLAPWTILCCMSCATVGLVRTFCMEYLSTCDDFTPSSGNGAYVGHLLNGMLNVLPGNVTWAAAPLAKGSIWYCMAPATKGFAFVFRKGRLGGPDNVASSPGAGSPNALSRTLPLFHELA